MSDLKLKMKRLLVTDRRLGRGKRSDDKADRRYAFYSQKPQGSGVEVMFSGYEAFALLAALIVLEHGIPQAKVVSILREVRSDFEAAHRDTLQKDPKELFDPHSIRAMARSGMFAVDNTSPVFLAFVKLDIGRGRVHAFIAVCRGLDALGKVSKGTLCSWLGGHTFRIYPPDAHPGGQPFANPAYQARSVDDLILYENSEERTTRTCRELKYQLSYANPHPGVE